MEHTSFFIKERALFGNFPTQDSVNCLEENGVRYFVNLTYSTESRIVQYVVSSKSTKISFPIKDHHIPPNWTAFASFIIRISQIITTLPKGHLVYIHCRGGHGRVGVVVAVILAYIFGYGPLTALQKTREAHARRPALRPKWLALGSPQRRRQKAFVYKFFEDIKLHRLQYKTIRYECGWSRYSEHPVKYKNVTYQTSETALLAQKYPAVASKIKNLSAVKALTYIKHNQTGLVIHNWNKKRHDLLLDIYKSKLTQYPYMKRKLLDSGFRNIILCARGNYHWPDGSGNNVCGEILKKIRHEAQQGFKKTYVS